MSITIQTSWLSDYDLYLLGEGTHSRAYAKMGAHLAERSGQQGVHFAVWAPNAGQVSVIGDFNGWNPESNPSETHGTSGIWECFIKDVVSGAAY